MSYSNLVLKKIFVINLLVISFSSFLFSVDPIDGATAIQNQIQTGLRDQRNIFSGFRNKADELRAERKYRLELKLDREKLTTELDEMKKELTCFEQEQAKDSSEREELDIKIAKKKQDVKDKKQELDWVEAYLIDDSWGKIFFSAFAGKDSKLFDRAHFRSSLEGLYKGIAYSSLVPVQKALSNTVDGYVNRFFNGTFGKIEEFVSFIYRQIFHKGSYPFSVEEINYWKKLIGSDLREIDFMIKNAEKNESRGRSEILREYEEDENEKQVINLWQDFIEDLAITYENLAEEIEIRKNYYKKNNNGYGVSNCASRLQNKLLKTRDIFLSVKSLKDLANLPEAKSIVPTMKKSFDTYFDNLADLIRPLNGKKSSVLGTTSSYNSDRWGGDSGSYSSGAYPHPRSGDYS